MSDGLRTDRVDAVRHRRQLALGVLLYLFAWFVIAVVAATTSFIALGGRSTGEWAAIFGIMLEFFYVWAAIAVGVYWLQRRMSVRPMHLFPQALVHALALVVLLIALPFLIHGADWRDWLVGQRAAGFHALNAFLYAFVLISCKMLEYYQLGRAKEAELFEAELRRAELEASLERSRMDALRAQINPHFLFNTLNSLAALIEASADREAYEVVERLATILRNTLDHSCDRSVTLREELEFLDAYVAIEKIRYGERLSVSTSVPENCLDLNVPSFSLQPLVENAIKHGVAATNDAVTINVAANCDDGKLELRVSDDGPGVRAPVRTGVGLGNLQSRLAHLFDGSAKLEIGNDTHGGTTVAFVIPCEAAGSPLALPHH